MDTQQTNNLIRQFFNSKLTNDLKIKFGYWFVSDHLKADKKEALYALWDEETIEADANTLEDLELMHARIKKISQKSFWLTRFVQVAAAVALLVMGSFASYLFLNSENKNVETKMLQCFVPNGERKEIQLPDGSKVWVNAGSLMVYPEKFNGKTRSIYLYGKAEFSVVKNKTKPFIVKTNQLDVQALGTVFTVTSYPEENITMVMLDEGSIRVNFNNKVTDERVLVPNELLTFSHKTNKMTIRTIDSEQYSKWKEGYVIFQSATIGEIFKDIERRHGVTIYYDRQKLGPGIYNIKFLPNETLEDDLQVLKTLIQGFKYKIKDNNIYIN